MRAAILCLLVGLVSREASAYPWMNRHGYDGCASCHADPSGSGLLTPYGRAQSELLLSTRYGRADEEPSRASGALFGVTELPAALLAGGWLRSGCLWSSSDGRLVDRRLLLMRADLGAQVTIGRLRASGVLGYAIAESASLSRQAWVTSNTGGGNLVSREHWLGWDVNENVLVRAGRLNLPFGLRNVEHTSWVRSETRTDVNQQQQHGVAAAFSGERLRAEAIVMLGSFQLSPDAYRERGVAAYAELAVAPGQTVGVSTLVVRSALDLGTRKETVRQAHGVFTRLSPSKAVAFLGEADVLVDSVGHAGAAVGVAGFLQGDVELLQGLHGMLTLETLRRARSAAEWGWGAGVGAAWFFVPHLDLRGDAVRRAGLGAPTTMTYLLQLHGYL